MIKVQFFKILIRNAKDKGGKEMIFKYDNPWKPIASEDVSILIWIDQSKNHFKCIHEIED